MRGVKLMGPDAEGTARARPLPSARLRQAGGQALSVASPVARFPSMGRRPQPW